MVSKVVSISLICEGSTLSMYELHPFWLAKGTKNVCDNVFNDYVASLEPSRAEIFRKAWYCGSPVGTAFSKAFGATIRAATHYNGSVYIVPRLGCQPKGCN